jgi:hypothetical protein
MAYKIAGTAATARELDRVHPCVEMLGFVKKTTAAMPVLAISSTRATDCLDVEGEMYFLLNLGWSEY